MNNSNSSTSTINFDFSEIDFTSYLPSVFGDNPFYTDYFDALTDTWQNSIFPYMRLFSNIRQTIDLDTKDPQELYILIRNANLLGYKFISNFLNQKDYLKLVDFIARYYELEGTKQFANFLGYVKASKIKIEQLWSQVGINDYTEFYYKSEIDTNNTILSNPGQTTPGTWYPTSHKRISYDLTLFQNVSHTQLVDYETTIRSLFYTLAPIHWVLELIAGTIEFNDPHSIDVQASSYIFGISIVDHEVQNLSVGGDPLTFNGINLTTLELV